MDVKYLKYVLAIAKRKNMTKAAEELYVSQSSLSQYLAKLEQEVGTPLFFRAKNELTLTRAGELYVEAAQKVIQIQQELYQNIASLDQRSHIRVGVTSNFGLRMLSEIIPKFKQSYPEVTIEISEVGLPELKKLLSEERLDLGIAATLDVTPFENQSHILRREKVLFAIPKKHIFAQTHPVADSLTADELVSHFRYDHFLLSKQGSTLRGLSDQFFYATQFIPSAFCETNNITATRNMISMGTGVAFIAESCSINRDRIRYYSLVPELYRLNVIFTRKNWIQNEPETLFVSYLTHYFEEHTEELYLAEEFTTG